MLSQDGTADFNYSELLWWHRAEVWKVLLNFPLWANVAQKLNDCRSSGELRVVGRRVGSTWSEWGGGEGCECSGRRADRSTWLWSENRFCHSGCCPRGWADLQHCGSEHAAAEINLVKWIGMDSSWHWDWRRGGCGRSCHIGTEWTDSPVERGFGVDTNRARCV